MTTMDVHLKGLNGFGQEVGEIFAFWWDGDALRDALGDALKPTDPWPAWHVTMLAEDLKPFALEHPNIWQTRRVELNAELDDLLERSVEVRVLIMEG
jgi:hypothetical protein